MQHNTAIKSLSEFTVPAGFLTESRSVEWTRVLNEQGWEEIPYRMCLILPLERQFIIITMNNLESGHYFLLQYLWTLKNEACNNVWSSAHTFKASFQVGQAHRFHRRMCDPMLRICFTLQYHAASWDKTSCSPIKNWVGFPRQGVGEDFKYLQKSYSYIPNFQKGWVRGLVLLSFQLSPSVQIKL